MKTAVRITLLLLWICALTVPSFVTVLNSGDNPVLVININEEEHQEQTKTDIEEKQLTNHGSSLLLFPYNKKLATSDYFIISLSKMIGEIVLPPPEPLV